MATLALKALSCLLRLAFISIVGCRFIDLFQPPLFYLLASGPIFGVHLTFRKRLRTSNMCETLNTQIKRRTKVAGLFPNEASILRLVSAILMDISEEWESGKTYLPQIETH